MKAIHLHISLPGILTVFILFLIIVFIADCRPLYSSILGSESSETLFSEKLFLDLKGINGFSVREFNRVDGFSPTFKLGIKGIEEEKYPVLDLAVIYYVERKTPGWEVSLEKSFFRPFEQKVTLEAFRLTNTNDRWRISDLENSIASFLFKEDFRNYFETRGTRFSFDMEIEYFHMITVAYTDQEIRSLRASDPFTLFGWAKEFRVNPSIDEGKERSLLLRWIYDSRDNMRFPRRGWHNSISFEGSPDAFHGDFSYRLFKTSIRQYNTTPGNHLLNFRLSLALSSDDLPQHKLFTIGGVGTLRGYPDLSDSGRNFLLGTVEYRFPIRGLNWKPLRILFNQIQGVLFLDVGDAWSEKWDISRLRTNIGAGFTGANIFSYFGLYVAQALESNWRDPRVTVKMERAF